jgi:hypothetical protein
MGASDDSDDDWLVQLMDQEPPKKRHKGLAQSTLALVMYFPWPPNSPSVTSFQKLGKGAKTGSWSDANYEEKLEMLDKHGSIDMRVMRGARHRTLCLLTPQQNKYSHMMLPLLFPDYALTKLLGYGSLIVASHCSILYNEYDEALSNYPSHSTTQPARQGRDLLEGAVLVYVRGQVSQLIDKQGAQLCIHKVGITCHPIQRSESYFAENYSLFSVLHISKDFKDVAWLEAILIADADRRPGACRNVRKGGDGKIRSFRDKPPFFLYMVTGRADSRCRVG